MSWRQCSRPNFSDSPYLPLAMDRKGSTCDDRAWIYDGANRTYDLGTPKLTIAKVADRPLPVLARAPLIFYRADIGAVALYAKRRLICAPCRAHLLGVGSSTRASVSWPRRSLGMGLPGWPTILSESTSPLAGCDQRWTIGRRPFRAITCTSPAVAPLRPWRWWSTRCVKGKDDRSNARFLAPDKQRRCCLVAWDAYAFSLSGVSGQRLPGRQRVHVVPPVCNLSTLDSDERTESIVVLDAGRKDRPVNFVLDHHDLPIVSRMLK